MSSTAPTVPDILSAFVWRTALALVVTTCAGCSGVATPMPELVEEINATLTPDPFVVRPGDVLDIRFFRKPEWNFASRVRPDGRASFTGMDEVEVAGKTLAEVDQLLTKFYGTTPEKPDVTVDFASLGEDAVANARAIHVIGEVLNPGPIAVQGEHITLIEALARAGGPDKRTANLHNTMLVRWLPHENRRIAWRLDASVDHWGTPLPLLLQANDLVFVPNTAIDDIDIWVDQYIRQLIPFGFALPIPVE